MGGGGILTFNKCSFSLKKFFKFHLLSNFVSNARITLNAFTSPKSSKTKTSLKHYSVQKLTIL